ncbi:MAG: hypothetical protein GY842_14060 [bacterium]|nr:hypothetical protein [bacterium]
MLHALRAEFTYALPVLLGGLGIATGVIIILSVVFFAVGEDGPPSHTAAGMRGMFLILAPMIVGFIVQAYRSEERRARLLLAGPFTPRQLVGVDVLLPVILFGIGILAAGLVLGVEYLVTGIFEPEGLHTAGFVGGQMFTYVQIAHLPREATAARRQRRPRAAAAAWAGFVVALLLLGALYLVLAQGMLGWPHMILGHLTIAVTAMVASMALYEGRTDFTR